MEWQGGRIPRLRPGKGQAGRRLEGASREEILARILSNPVAKAHGDFFRSMTDDQLRELVSRATGMLAARLEVSP